VRRGEVARLLTSARPGDRSSRSGVPTETRRTSSGAGCDTPASAARRKPSRWAGTTRTERELRVEPRFRRGATPGSGRAAGEPEERHSANNRKEGPVLCRWGWRGATSRGARRRATGAAWHRGSSGFYPGRGGNPPSRRQPTRCAGQPAAPTRLRRSHFGRAGSSPGGLPVERHPATPAGEGENGRSGGSARERAPVERRVDAAARKAAAPVG
jgi:hypothetical protein